MKNIKFPKGLARKLIPKFIGPYKILEDFGNESFKIDLLKHLKQRGVHDSFHASLLRIHVPNDDRLFPGQLDTQLGNADGTEGEWAVDHIMEHAGSKMDAIFEIQWKMGDVTWLPYYQASHLTALQQYFDVLSIKNVSQLAKAKGQPPSNDPQTFLGNLVPRYQTTHKRCSQGKDAKSKFPFPSSTVKDTKSHPLFPSSVGCWITHIIDDIISCSSNARHLALDNKHHSFDQEVSTWDPCQS